MPESLLSVQNLSKEFKINSNSFHLFSPRPVLKAVDSVTFDLYHGETLGIVGESGCGKSTLGRMITGLTQPTQGSILFDGHDLLRCNAKELRRLRQEIMIVFQDPFSSLDPRMRVEDTIAEPLKSYCPQMSRADRHARVLELLDSVGLNPAYARRFPHEFSGGQRQRIGIARAIALHPKLVVCDEAVSALDVSVQAQILNLLKQLQAQYNMSYVFIAHGLNVVRYMSDRIAVMYLGKIMEIGPRDDIYNKRLHPYTQALFSAIPVADPFVERERAELLKGDVPSPINPPPGCRFWTRCPRCMEECKKTVPELHLVEENHLVACHLFKP